MADEGEADAEAPAHGLEIGLDEARRSFDKQVETLRAIDDLSVGTLRVAIVLLGLVASTLTLGGTDRILGLSVAAVLLLAIGTVELLLSAVLASFAYGQDLYPIGVGVGRNGDTSLYDAWIREPDALRSAVLRTYTERIDSLNETIRHQADLLQSSLALLIAATVALFGAALVTILHRGFDLPLAAQFLYLGGYVALFPLAVVLGDRLSPPRA